MTNRTEELKALIIQSLDTPQGIILSVSGDEPGRRQLAMAALVSAKRELLPDVVEVINIVIKPVPNNPDEIAIIRIRPGELIDVG